MDPERVQRSVDGPSCEGRCSFSVMLWASCCGAPRAAAPARREPCGTHQDRPAAVRGSRVRWDLLAPSGRAWAEHHRAGPRAPPSQPALPARDSASVGRGSHSPAVTFTEEIRVGADPHTSSPCCPGPAVGAAGVGAMGTPQQRVWRLFVGPSPGPIEAVLPASSTARMLTLTRVCERS